MELTGKAKEEFEKWLLNGDDSEEYRFGQNLSTNFELLPYSFKYGVYVDWFDSVGLRIYLKEWGELEYSYCFYEYDGDRIFTYKSLKSRQDAREQAINKANELYNNR